MNSVIRLNKTKILERLVLQDVVECYGSGKATEQSYDVLMTKLPDRIMSFYGSLELDYTSLQKLKKYGNRAEIYKQKWRNELDQEAANTTRQIAEQLSKSTLLGCTQWEAIQLARTFLSRRMAVLSHLLSALALQMKNYMLLWDYQDAGFTHYCLLTEGENCDDCNSLEGQVFPISEARVGENFIPMHLNCNCWAGVLDKENRVVAIIAEGAEHEPQEDDKSWLDSVSNLLTATSFIPGLDTFTNLASIPVDLARGDWLSAGLSAFGVIPVVGEVADTAKLAKMADKTSDAAKVANKVDNVGDSAKTLKKSIKYPGNNPSQSPGKGFEWRGNSTPDKGKGNWYNPKTREKWNADLKHGDPIGPHWDYSDAKGNSYRVFPDGRIEKK